MGFMDFAKSAGGAILNHVAERTQRMSDAEDEAYGMDAEELARALNHASGDKLHGYVKAAKNRGDIGRDSHGNFYAK